MVVVVVVEGRQPHCWSCKQIGHLTKVCLQRTADLVQWPRKAKINNTNNSTNTTGTTDTTKDTTSKTTDTTNVTPEETSNKWMQVTQRRRKKKEEELPKAPAPKESTPTKSKTPQPPSSVTQRIPSMETLSTQETRSSSPHPAAQEATLPTSPRSKDNSTPQEAAMDVTLNLKRRRDSGEDEAKKHFKATKPQPQQNPSLNKTPAPTTIPAPTTFPAGKIPLPRTSAQSSPFSSNPSTKSNQPSCCSPCLFSPSASQNSQTIPPPRLSLRKAATQPNKKNFRNLTKNVVSLTYSEQRQYSGSNGFVFNRSGGHFRFPAPEDAKATAWPRKKSRKKKYPTHSTLDVHPWWQRSSVQLNQGGVEIPGEG